MWSFFHDLWHKTEENKYATLASHMHLVKSRYTFDVIETIIDTFTNCLLSTQITWHKRGPVIGLYSFKDPDFWLLWSISVQKPPTRPFRKDKFLLIWRTLHSISFRQETRANQSCFFTNGLRMLKNLVYLLVSNKTLKYLSKIWCHKTNKLGQIQQ